MSEIEVKTFDYVIIGAGVAGLSAGLELTEQGKKVLVIERDQIVGGLSKTLEYKGFLFDYCAHRFHSANPKVMNRVLGLMGAKFKKHRQISRILMFNRYLKYPFEIQNLLRAMPFGQAIISGISFIYSQFRKIVVGNKIVITNYAQWFSHHFGQALYKVMCEPYTSKIWKTSPHLLSADWADQRFQGVKLMKLVKKIVFKLVKLDFSSYSLEDDNLAPDGGEFWYGERGIQELPDAYAESIHRQGGVIQTEACLETIDFQKQIITYKQKGGLATAIFKESVISTIPLHNLYSAFPEKDEVVKEQLNQIKYMDIIFVYLLLNKDNVSKDHWLYFPDNKIIYNRSVEFKNWSEAMCPPGKTAICLDITCYEGDATWKMTDQELVDRCVKDSVYAQLINEIDVYDSFVVRVKKAYPFYDLDYKKKLLTVVDFFEKSGRLICLGRTGAFRYNNADGSIEMGMEIAEKLKALESGKLRRDQITLKDHLFKYISY